MKPKHPTPKSVRAGQTIYQVGVDYHGNTFVSHITVGGKRTPDPEPGVIISLVSPQFLRGLLARMQPWLTRYTFYSRRKAETFRGRLQHQLNRPLRINRGNNHGQN